jgi:hypothetical protein
VSAHDEDLPGADAQANLAKIREELTDEEVVLCRHHVDRVVDGRARQRRDLRRPGPIGFMHPPARSCPRCSNFEKTRGSSRKFENVWLVIRAYTEAEGTRREGNIMKRYTIAIARVDEVMRKSGALARLQRTLGGDPHLAVGAGPSIGSPQSIEGRPATSTTDERDAIAFGDAIDTDGGAEHVAATGLRLAARLAQVNPFDATQAAVTAALSSTIRVRQTIAEALLVPFRLVGDDFVLDALARDPDIAVRAAAVRARVARGLALPRTPAAAESQPLRVLVIDDYPGGRAALCACLSELGCDAMGASSKVASHDIAWRDLVDIAITNHDPPWSDAEKLVGEVRRRAPGLPAILLKYPTIEKKNAPIPIPNAITLVNPIALDDLATAIHALAPRTLHGDGTVRSARVRDPVPPEPVVRARRAPGTAHSARPSRRPNRTERV